MEYFDGERHQEGDEQQDLRVQEGSGSLW